MALTDNQKNAMIELLVQEDISDIKRSADNGDYEFLGSILKGDGWKPYLRLREFELEAEFAEREFYGNPNMIEEFGSRMINNSRIATMMDFQRDEGLLEFDIEPLQYGLVG